MSDILVNSNGVNAKIKATILSEKEMRSIGFTDSAKDRWYFYRNIITEKAKRRHGYSAYDFEVSFSVVIPKDGSDIRIDVLDEAFCQPYDYQHILKNNPTHKVALQVKENVEEWMKYLQDKGVLEGHIYGEYI